MKLNKTETRRRRNRAFKKTLEYITNYKAVFLTITFNDDAFKNLKDTMRIRKVREYLKKECALYIANVDYGKKGNREHFHALAIATTYTEQDLTHYKDKNELMKYKNHINLKAWKYGTINAERIIIKKGDEENTAERLTEHYFKETTIKDNVKKLIYSKGERPIKDQIARTRQYMKDNGIFTKDQKSQYNELSNHIRADLKKGEKLIKQLNK